MTFQSLQGALLRFMDRFCLEDAPPPPPSEQERLLHRLHCVALSDAEARSVQTYLTTVLEARAQHNDSDSHQLDGIVLEMNEADFEQFSSLVGGNRTHLFRVISQDSNRDNPGQKLVVFGESGLHLFHILVKQSNDPAHRQ